MNGQNLIDTLKNPRLYDHPVTKLEIIETHISWVILTGPYAYKVKKPVDFGFLDFSSLANRRHYCELELDLNRRLAPDYYLDVVPITGSAQNPALYGRGDVIEYALKMVQFPPNSELDKVLALGKLDTHYMDLIAEKIAKFHKIISVAKQSQKFGDLQHVHQPVINCYQEIRKHLNETEDIQRINALENWSCRAYEDLKKVFVSRKENGFVRECHGDLHLRNIAMIDDEIVIFDCIEFNEDLRWNDVISEISFLVMDLDEHKQSALASHFLNRYLELTGDYSGLKVFRYYLVYRAVVRAMVSCIRWSQGGIHSPDMTSEYQNFQNYLNLAEKYIDLESPRLFIMHGLSGSGKSTVSQTLLQAKFAIRIRSDIERKRLHDIKASQKNRQGVQEGIYSSTSSEEVYQHLFELAKSLLNSGYSVVVDATFLKIAQREMFQRLADMFNVEYAILHCYAPLNVMRNRVVRRNMEESDASDADLKVLEFQIKQVQKFTGKEMRYVVDINTQQKIKEDKLLKRLFI
ncbi:MAG: AAA family ATPase [Gammaproteobacteria bacterium]|nr:AAA family ATPase [Gammaproteobacteria bacterium]